MRNRRYGIGIRVAIQARMEIIPHSLQQGKTRLSVCLLGEQSVHQYLRRLSLFGSWRPCHRLATCLGILKAQLDKLINLLLLVGVERHKHLIKYNSCFVNLHSINKKRPVRGAFARLLCPGTGLLSRSAWTTTIGADGLNCRVRNGIGCDPVAGGTRTEQSHYRRESLVKN